MYEQGQIKQLMQLLQNYTSCFIWPCSYFLKLICDNWRFNKDKFRIFEV